MKEMLEMLESREGLLKKHIDEDKGWITDRVNGRFFAGRVVIEEHWLEETQKMIEFVKRSGE